jgi:hypothetical protein
MIMIENLCRIVVAVFMVQMIGLWFNFVPEWVVVEGVEDFKV